MLNTKFEKELKEYLETRTSTEILDLVYAINGYNGELEDLLWFYWNKEFFDLYFSNAEEAARAAYFGKIRHWQDTYIRFNVYGNLESTSYIDYDQYDIKEIIESLNRVPVQYLSENTQEFIKLWEEKNGCHYDEEYSEENEEE